MSIHPHSTLFSRTVYNPIHVPYIEVPPRTNSSMTTQIPRTSIGTQSFSSTAPISLTVSQNPYQRPVSARPTQHLPVVNPPIPTSNTYFSTTSRAVFDAQPAPKRAASARARPPPSQPNTATASRGITPSQVAAYTNGHPYPVARPVTASCPSRTPSTGEKPLSGSGDPSYGLTHTDASSHTQAHSLATASGQLDVRYTTVGPGEGGRAQGAENSPADSVQNSIANSRNAGDGYPGGLRCSIPTVCGNIHDPAKGACATHEGLATNSDTLHVSPSSLVALAPSTPHTHSSRARPATASTSTSNTNADPNTNTALINTHTAPPRVAPAPWSMEQARVWWLERQRDMLESKAAERDHAVEQMMRQKLVISDVQRLLTSLRSDNEQLTLALAAMVRGREEEVAQLVEEVKKRFERHRTTLLEDNRQLAAVHREDEERIKALTALAAERADEINALNIRLSSRDEDVAKARETANIWESRHECLLLQTERLREEKESLVHECHNKGEQISLLEARVDTLQREKEEIERVRVTVEQLLSEERQGRERAEHERRLSERAKEEAWASARAAEDRARSTDEIVRVAKAEVVREREKREEAQARVEASEVRAVELGSEIKRLQEALSEACTRAAAHEAHVTCITREREDAAAAKTSSESECAALREAKARAEAETALWRAEVDAAKTREQELQRVLAQVREDYAHVRGQVDASQRAVAVAEQRARMNEEKALQATQQCSEAVATSQISKQRVEEAQARVAELLSAKALLEHDASSRARELRAITKQYVSLHGEYSGVRAELASVRAQLHAYANMHAQMQTQQLHSFGYTSGRSADELGHGYGGGVNMRSRGSLSRARTPSRSPPSRTASLATPGRGERSLNTASLASQPLSSATVTLPLGVGGAHVPAMLIPVDALFGDDEGTGKRRDEDYDDGRVAVTKEEAGRGLWGR